MQKSESIFLSPHRPWPSILVPFFYHSGTGLVDPGLPLSYHSGTELAMNNLTIRIKVREGKILYCGPLLKILKNTEILYHSVTILVLNCL